MLLETSSTPTSALHGTVDEILAAYGASIGDSLILRMSPFQNCTIETDEQATTIHFESVSGRDKLTIGRESGEPLGGKPKSSSQFDKVSDLGSEEVVEQWNGMLRQRYLRDRELVAVEILKSEQ